MSRCSAVGCERPIIWAKSAATGKAMPIDDEPDKAGNVWIKDGFAYVYKNAALALEAGAKLSELRTSHFATCSRASQFRIVKG